MQRRPSWKAMCNLWNNGIIDFNCGPKTYELNVSKNFAGNLGLSGTANSSISDSNGNLLFLVSRNSVFTADGKFMQGGARTLSYDTFYYASIRQTLITPYPGNKHKYYIFFRENFNGRPLKLILTFNYAVVDMRLNNGKGGVTEVKRDLYPEERNSTFRYSLMGTRHRNRTDYWLAYVDQEVIFEDSTGKMGRYQTW